MRVSVQVNGDGDEGGDEGGRGRQRPAPELEDTGVVGERAMGKGERGGGTAAVAAAAPVCIEMAFQQTLCSTA